LPPIQLGDNPDHGKDAERSDREPGTYDQIIFQRHGGILTWAMAWRTPNLFRFGTLHRNEGIIAALIGAN
jgi:hypothetical protein